MSRIDVTTPASVAELEDVLSRPTPPVLRAFGELDGDLLLLGAGGKMGPTLGRMAQRAADESGTPRRVIGVSRFSDDKSRAALEASGVETIACDLLDERAIAGLPNAENVIFLVGMKFGSSSNPSLTWAMNCYLPALISKRFDRSRISVFSSGNVYGNVPVASGGSIETDPPNPVGEYAMTVLGRERMFEHFSRQLGIPVAILRLNYATELRYGVLVDLARRVLSEQPIDLTMGFVNVIWQAEANAMALTSLLHCDAPPRVLNIAGAEILRVQDVCQEFGRLLDKTVRFEGQEAADALLNNARQSWMLLGEPSMSAARMIRWTADWVRRGGESLGKPTHFEGRDGRF